MQIELCLETVTPLFLGGAEQQAELRPASVRGALRYWLRALLGNEAGGNLEKLSQRERMIFGSVDAASPITVRIKGQPSLMTSFDLERDATRRDKNGNLQPVRNGHNYLYYSTKLPPNNRVPYNPAEKFSLTFQTRPIIAKPAESLHLALASVWLLTHLGGLGTRARRCAGSISVESISSIPVGLPAFKISAANHAALQTEIAAGLKQIRSGVTATTPSCLRYDILDPQVCRIWIINGNPSWRTWKAAVEAIGAEMKSYRASQGVNRNSINSIFGVPILHGSSHGLQRRSSPLWLRITKLTNGEFVCVATLFKSDFKDGTHEVGGGYQLIEDFITTNLHGQEVIYV